MGRWTEGCAARCDLLDAAPAGSEGDVFGVDEHGLESEEVVAGDARSEPAVVLVDAAGGAQDFADNAREVPVGAAGVLEAEVGVHLVETVGRVDDGRVAVDQASHRQPACGRAW